MKATSVVTIYAIKCLAEDKYYIGSSTCPAQRYKLHGHDLLTKTHHCAALQQAFDSHGPSSMVYSPIITPLKPTEGRYIESLLTDYLKAHDLVYNSFLAGFTEFFGKQYEALAASLFRLRTNQYDPLFHLQWRPTTIGKLAKAINND